MQITIDLNERTISTIEYLKSKKVYESSSDAVEDAIILALHNKGYCHCDGCDKIIKLDDSVLGEDCTLCKECADACENMN